MVELEKREGACPYARFYPYKSISRHKENKEAVRCLMNGTIHDPKKIIYCAKRFELCEIYRKNTQMEESRS